MLMSKIGKKENRIHTIGRRKEATCRVYIKKSEKSPGVFFVNGKTPSEYFDGLLHLHAIYLPLKTLKMEKEFDVHCFVKGSGKNAQAEAIRLALSRALKAYEDHLWDAGAPTGVVAANESEEEDSGEGSASGAVSLRRPWHALLRKHGLLTCDDRRVERKKFGFRKARKREQYKKR